MDLRNFSFLFSVFFFLTSFINFLKKNIVVGVLSYIVAILIALAIFSKH